MDWISPPSQPSGHVSESVPVMEPKPPPSNPTELAVAGLPKTRREELRMVEQTIDYEFSDLALLNQALTHSSFNNLMADSPGDYESLEFLGDAILGFVISEILYQRFPEHTEGTLSKLRSHLVSRSQLARMSAKIGIHRFVLLSPGEEQTGGRRKTAILGDIFESLLAAIYLDGGIEAARRVILQQFDPVLEDLQRRDPTLKDHKSRLQELLHTRGLREPNYRIVSEKGPDHRKEFLIEAWIDNQPAARAWGRSKKDAEQRAAEQALSGLENS